MKRLMLVSLIALMLLSCLGCRQSEKDDQEKKEETTEQSASENEFFQSNEKTFKIDTPYCALYYSEEWKDSVKVDVASEEPYTADFTALLDGHNVALFSIVIGKDFGEGYALGTLKTDKGEVTVYLIDRSGDIAVELSDESQLVFEHMCEDVNVIISNLVYKSGMIMNG